MPEKAIAPDVAGGFYAKAVIDGIAAVETVRHLAVGTATVDLDPQGEIIPAEQSAKGLRNEIGRVLFEQRKYVVQDDTGPIIVGNQRYREANAGETAEVYFLFRFLETEAQGDWTEFALIGDGVTYISRGAVLVDGTQVGDDRANAEVVLGGGYTGDENQLVTVTVDTGGGTGVAVVDWSSTGDIGSGSATVTFNSAVVIGGGLTLTFDGGVDALLTQGDQWEIRCTRDPESATFAAGGVYDPVANEAGQVANAGTPVRIYHRDPPETKGAAAVNIQLVGTMMVVEVEA